VLFTNHLTIGERAKFRRKVSLLLPSEARMASLRKFPDSAVRPIAKRLIYRPLLAIRSSIFRVESSFLPALREGALADRTIRRAGNGRDKSAESPRRE
jgi:hypothetical protein